MDSKTITLSDSKAGMRHGTRTYKSRRTARQAAEKLNQAYGAHRYNVVGGL